MNITTETLENPSMDYRTIFPDVSCDDANRLWNMWYQTMPWQAFPKETSPQKAIALWIRTIKRIDLAVDSDDNVSKLESATTEAISYWKMKDIILDLLTKILSNTVESYNSQNANFYPLYFNFLNQLHNKQSILRHDIIDIGTLQHYQGEAIDHFKKCDRDPLHLLPFFVNVYLPIKLAHINKGTEEGNSKDLLWDKLRESSTNDRELIDSIITLTKNITSTDPSHAEDVESSHYSFVVESPHVNVRDILPCQTASFGKVMKRYSPYVYRINGRGVWYKTKFGIKKLRSNKVGLYLKGGAKKYYVYRWSSK